MLVLGGACGKQQQVTSIPPGNGENTASAGNESPDAAPSECEVRFASSGATSPASDAMQAALSRLDNARAACAELGELLPITGLAVIAPAGISVPSTLDGIAVFRVSSDKEAQALASTGHVSDLVEVKLSGDAFLCAYERLVDQPSMAGHTMAFWKVWRTSDGGICMKVDHLIVTFARRFAPPRSG